MGHNASNPHPPSKCCDFSSSCVSFHNMQTYDGSQPDSVVVLKQNDRCSTIEALQIWRHIHKQVHKCEQYDPFLMTNSSKLDIMDTVKKEKPCNRNPYRLANIREY